ncbi:MAG: FkbM family methyltransferase [Spirochaetaceae bacterium]|jgi:FkbM family methyltransferase|nr:FkbM family methyltransferase [Spirochaetaceae bacterium]
MKIIKTIIKWLMPHGLYIPLSTLYGNQKRYNEHPSLDLQKYHGYRPAGGMGDKLQIYIDYVKKDTTIAVTNIFEVGANFAQDADYLMESFFLKPENIYVFEAHPEIYEAIKKIHNFNAYNYAVFNENREMEFNINPLTHENTGWSSLFWETGTKIKVDAIRMDDFMNNNNIKTIDFLKIDVEGATYHVIDGFGSRLKDVKCIQLEAEHNKFAEIPYEQIAELLLANEFELIHFERNNHMNQSDSFWVRREYVKYA